MALSMLIPVDQIIARGTKAWPTEALRMRAVRRSVLMRPASIQGTDELPCAIIMDEQVLDDRVLVRQVLMRSIRVEGSWIDKRISKDTPD